MSLRDKQAIIKDLPSLGLISTSFVPCAQDFVGAKSVSKYYPGTDESFHLQTWTEIWIENLKNQNLDPKEIEARLAIVNGSAWSERQVVAGRRFDVDALSLAIAKVKGMADPAPFLRRIQEEKGYAAMAMKVPDVIREYNSITGKVAAVGDL
jgi:hypothetical protein